MWQDGLTLLIVAIAVVGLLRACIPTVGIVRGLCGPRRVRGGLAHNTGQGRV